MGAALTTSVMDIVLLTLCLFKKGEYMNKIFIRVAKFIGRMITSSNVRGWILRCYYPLVRGKKVLRTINGINYALDLDEIIDVSVSLGIFEVDVQRCLSRFCKPGMAVLDIGANIGAHALSMGQFVSPAGMVYAFEPTSYAHKKLVENIALNPKLPVMAFRMALSDHDEENQEINFRSSWCTNGGRKDEPCYIDYIRLDHWMEIYGSNCPIKVIKMDVDGNEFPIIIGGAGAILQNCPIFIMEAVGLHFENDARNPILWLWEHGWRFSTLDGKRKFQSIEEMSSLLPRNDLQMTKSINVLGIHQEQLR